MSIWCEGGIDGTLTACIKLVQLHTIGSVEEAYRPIIRCRQHLKTIRAELNHDERSLMCDDKADRATGDIPDSYRAIGASSSELCAIRAECASSDRAGMSVEYGGLIVPLVALRVVAPDENISCGITHRTMACLAIKGKPADDWLRLRWLLMQCRSEGKSKYRLA